MEVMPNYTDEAQGERRPRWSVLPAIDGEAASGWSAGLPTMAGPVCTLRELAATDAPSLYAQLTTEEVARFISPPPTSVEGFEQFIAWAHRERSQGRYACFAVVPAGSEEAVGIFQVAVTDPHDRVADWGFVIGSKYWGTGMFLTGARRVLEFAFTTLRVERLEARAVPENGRGTGALLKVGAIREALLRGSLVRCGKHLDQALWVITRRSWRADALRRRTAVFERTSTPRSPRRLLVLADAPGTQMEARGFSPWRRPHGLKPVRSIPGVSPRR
jgi:ribosomal-protein-alanine N-acetyltransferase